MGSPLHHENTRDIAPPYKNIIRLDTSIEKNAPAKERRNSLGLSPSRNTDENNIKTEPSSRRNGEEVHMVSA